MLDLQVLSEFNAAVAARDHTGVQALSRRLLNEIPPLSPRSPVDIWAVLLEVAGWLKEQGCLVSAKEILERLTQEMRKDDESSKLLCAQGLDMLADIAASLGQQAVALRHRSNSIRLCSDEEQGYGAAWLFDRYEAQMEGARDIHDGAEEQLWQKRIIETERVLIETSGGTQTSGVRSITPDQDCEIVKVMFASNRNRAPGNRKNPYDYFRAEQSRLTFGCADVSVPLKRRLGQIIRPFWRMETRPLRSRYFVIQRPIDWPLIREARWIVDIRGQIETDPRREALIFVHGYRTSFHNALEIAAQLTIDLNIRGATVAFSWPSQGRIFGYTSDKDTVGAIAIQNDLAETLKFLVEHSGAARIHVVAHSMGCDLLLRALVQVAEDSQLHGGMGIFSNLIFMSPDVAIDDFLNRARKTRFLTKKFTAYGSKKDVALWISSQSWANNRRRAGAFPAEIAVDYLDSIDTLFAEENARDVFGHSIAALADVQALVWLGDDAGQRRTLRRPPYGDQTRKHWEFSADDLGYQHGLWLLRQFGRSGAKSVAVRCSEGGNDGVEHALWLRAAEVIHELETKTYQLNPRSNYFDECFLP